MHATELREGRQIASRSGRSLFLPLFLLFDVLSGRPSVRGVRPRPSVSSSSSPSRARTHLFAPSVLSSRRMCDAGVSACTALHAAPFPLPSPSPPSSSQPARSHRRRRHRVGRRFPGSPFERCGFRGRPMRIPRPPRNPFFRQAHDVRVCVCVCVCVWKR